MGKAGNEKPVEEEIQTKTSVTKEETTQAAGAVVAKEEKVDTSTKAVKHDEKKAASAAVAKEEKVHASAEAVKHDEKKAGATEVKVEKKRTSVAGAKADKEGAKVGTAKVHEQVSVDTISNDLINKGTRRIVQAAGIGGVAAGREQLEA